MKKSPFIAVQITCLICIAWINFSFAENNSETKTKITLKAQASTESIVKPQVQHGKISPKQETFDQFYERFTEAVNQNQWDKVIDMTKFPFMYKGQLDSEGEIEVAKEEFKKTFPAFLEKETYIDIEGELIPATLRGLLMSRMGTAESINSNSAQIHDFVFEKVGNTWKFVKVYTDLSITN